MNALRPRDIPPRAVILVLALVLVASVVVGREEVPAAQLAPPKVEQARGEPAATEDIDAEALARRPIERERQDLFASRSWAPPPAPVSPLAAARPPQPRTPTAPPLPFRYLGHRSDVEKLVVYLANGETTYNAVVGDTLEKTYRVESISESAVQFAYLPLATKQSLSIPPRQ